MQKLEGELKEAKAVHRELMQQHDMGDFEALSLADQKQKQINALNQQVAELSAASGLRNKPTNIASNIQLGPQEKNPEGAPRA